MISSSGLVIRVLLVLLLLRATGAVNMATKVELYKRYNYLSSSPHAGRTVHCRGGRRCTAVGCAHACASNSDTCVMHTYDRSSKTCVLSERPAGVPAAWNTYESVCPSYKGYRLFTDHDPMLCLRLVNAATNQLDGRTFCQGDARQGELVRAKTPAIYDIVVRLLKDEGYTGVVFVGADDRVTEGTFLWNDNTVFPRGTSMWADPNDGISANDDCLCMTATSKYFDCDCYAIPYPYVCQWVIGPP